MKTVVLLLVLAFIAGHSKAQLLQRIRDKAVQSIDLKKTNNNNSSSKQKTVQTENNINNTEEPSANCSLIFTLDKEEKFFHDESRIIAKNNILNYAFVIRNMKKEFFLIEDGKRTGPFTESPIVSSKKRPSGIQEVISEDIKMGNAQKDPMTAQYSKTIDGKLFVVFNGKNYGPYDHIAKILVSPDKSRFFAAVTIGGENNMMAKMGMGNSFMVNNNGLKMQAGKGTFVPMKFYASRNFNYCMITVMDQKTQIVSTVTSAGKRTETSMADLFSTNAKVTFVSDNGDIVTVPDQSPTQILVNGKEVASFATSILSPERLFLMPDYSKSVYYDAGKLYRGNGTEENLTGILFPKVITINNETAIYYFKVIKKVSI